MIVKFAHFSDMHLGYQKKPSLQEIERTVFEDAMDDCMRRSVDFVLICGDMFHVNIPEMRVQKFVFAKMRQMYEAGIPVYVVYGSHDFSPSGTSVIDLLAETGYITKVQKMKSHDDGDMYLDFITDEKTRVKMAGISGLAASKDIKYYEKLKHENLESESGFKIFLFHGAVSEMRTSDEIAATAEAAMPLSFLPKNFNYYAGGHIHNFSHKTFPNHPHVVYSGTPFAGYHSDLKNNAAGAKRGYVLVEFDNDKEKDVTNIKQIEIPNCDYAPVSISANFKRSDAVNIDISKEIDSIDPTDKIVILTVEGKLSEGKTTDINFGAIKDDLMSRGALDVEIKRTKLSSSEYEITESRGETADEIATNTFDENVGQVDSSFDALAGKKGADLANILLGILSKPSLENESLGIYQARLVEDAMAALGLLEADATDNYNVNGGSKHDS